MEPWGATTAQRLWHGHQIGRAVQLLADYIDLIDLLQLSSHSIPKGEHFIFI